MHFHNLVFRLFHRLHKIIDVVAWICDCNLLKKSKRREVKSLASRNNSRTMHPIRLAPNNS